MIIMKSKMDSREKSFKSLIGRISFFLVLVFFLVSLSLLGGFFYLMSEVKLGNTLETRKIAETSTIYDRTGEHILYKIHGEENRRIIPRNEIPDTIRIATVAIEDGSFYTHHGVDISAIARALKTNIKNKSASQGGSTITQQLARNAFLTREKTLERKVLEAIYAIKIERRYSKDEILDAYLNEVPYGSNAYGIEAAAETYFDKNASELTLDEATLLASMTKAPSYYSPYGANRDDLVKRQKASLSRIAELNLVDQGTVEEALSVNTLEKVVPINRTIHAPHFVFYVLEEMEKKYGRKMIEEGGFEIYTTLDWEKQKLAEKAVADNDPILKQYGASNAALVAIDPQTGEILSMVGSKNYLTKDIDGEVNVATRPRQPGSSFKPIVYAASFERGFQPETLVLDTQPISDRTDPDETTSPTTTMAVSME
jgi:membrane peptidoglycan carboxypeptidase